MLTNYNTSIELWRSPLLKWHDDVKIVRKNDLLKARAVRELTDKSGIKEGSQVRLYNKQRKEHASDRFLKVQYQCGAMKCIMLKEVRDLIHLQLTQTLKKQKYGLFTAFN